MTAKLRSQGKILPPISGTGGSNHEKVSSRECGVCSDSGTCNGSGYAGSTAASAGGLLRLDRRLYRLQCRRRLVRRRSYFPNPSPFSNVVNHGTGGSDGIFGFHAGAQWQWGAWVLGAEAALSGCFNECRTESGTLPNPPFTAPGGGNSFSEHKITNLFTAGGRLGYAWDRFMIFGTGGWASANLKGTYCSDASGLCDGPGIPSGASRNNGWYAGGGFDYMVHKGPLVDVILGLEYQHFDVGSKNAFCGNPTCTAGNSFDLDATGDIVRARLTIKTQGYRYYY